VLVLASECSSFLKLETFFLLGGVWCGVRGLAQSEVLALRGLSLRTRTRDLGARMWPVWIQSSGWELPWLVCGTSQYTGLDTTVLCRARVPVEGYNTLATRDENLVNSKVVYCGLVDSGCGDQTHSGEWWTVLDSCAVPKRTVVDCRGLMCGARIAR